MKIQKELSRSCKSVIIRLIEIVYFLFYFRKISVKSSAPYAPKKPIFNAKTLEKPLPIELVQALLETGRSHMTTALFAVTTHKPEKLLLLSWKIVESTRGYIFSGLWAHTQCARMNQSARGSLLTARDDKRKALTIPIFSRTIQTNANTRKPTVISEYRVRKEKGDFSHAWLTCVGGRDAPLSNSKYSDLLRVHFHAKMWRVCRI